MLMRLSKPTDLVFVPQGGAWVTVATKVGAVVGGQTSCKAPEIAAFEKYLPEDVEILPVHSLHGPNVDPRGQPLVFYYLRGIN